MSKCVSSNRIKLGQALNTKSWTLKCSQLQQQEKKMKEIKTKSQTSMLQKYSNTSLFSFGSREVEQRPAVGITDLRWVPLLQHSPDSADISRCHCSLDLQLLMKLRVPSAVMVQHPVTCWNGNVHLYLITVRKNWWMHSLCLGEPSGYVLKWSFWLSCQELVTYTHWLQQRSSTVQCNIQVSNTCQTEYCIMHMWWTVAHIMKQWIRSHAHCKHYV